MTIANMIRNEKYIGDALLQKKYTTDCLPYPQKRNRGEKPQYYVVETHSAIIERKVYKDANELLSSRSSEIRVQRNPDVPFRGILQCGCCGTLFKQKIHKKDTFWICRKHDEDRLACSITQIPEERIQSAFLRLYYKLKHHGGEIFASMLTNLQTIRNQRILWSLDIVELNKQISDLSSQNQMLAELKKQGLIDPDILIAQTNELTEQLRAAKLEKERLLAADGDNTSAQTRELMELLETGPDFLETFDGELFGELVEKIIVDSNEQLRFRLKNGLALTESIERTMR